MEERIVNNFGEFHSVIREFLSDRMWIFRGQQLLSWPLIPKLGRGEYRGLNRAFFMASFKRRALEFTSLKPENEWDWLALGQHHGLPTPLLDWTYNPLVAAFFAVYPYADQNSAVYAFRPRTFLDTETQTPEEFEGVGRIFPRGIAARISRQGGAFTYHNPPSCALVDSISEGDRLICIVIPKEYRKELIYELDRYCINQMTMFPDLDGLSQYIAWSGREDVRSFWRVRNSDEVT